MTIIIDTSRIREVELVGKEQVGVLMKNVVLPMDGMMIELEHSKTCTAGERRGKRKVRSRS